MATPNQTPVNQLLLAGFSLFLALCVWMIVRQQEVVTQTVLVPVVVNAPPPFIELSPEVPFEPASVPVTFSFPKGDERLATSSDFRLVIDASDLADRVSSTETYSRHTIVASRENLRFPSALTFVEFVEAPEVIFRARLRTVQVTVQPQVVDGRPEAGYRVLTDEVSVEPDVMTVAVDEARQILAREGPLTIQTEPIDPTGQSRSIRRVVGVMFDPDSGMYPLPDRPAPTVQVHVPISEIEETRVYEDVQIRFGTIRRNIDARLSPQSVNVTVFGPVGLLNRLTPDMIRVTPLPNEFIDDEAVGEPFSTSLEVSFDAPDPAFSQLRAEPEPSVVRIQFYEIQLPPDAVRTPSDPEEPAPITEEEAEVEEEAAPEPEEAVEPEEEPATEDVIEEEVVPEEAAVEEDEVPFVPDPEAVFVEDSPEEFLTESEDLPAVVDEPETAPVAEEELAPEEAIEPSLSDEAEPADEAAEDAVEDSASEPEDDGESADEEEESLNEDEAQEEEEEDREDAA